MSTLAPGSAVADTLPGGTHLAHHAELRHLRHFVAVAEERSFTRAAERLHLAQQALSSSVRQFETRLGVTLLRRRPSVELTPAGVQLLEDAGEILRFVDAAIARARAAGGTEAPALTVGYPPYMSGEVIAAVGDETDIQRPGLIIHGRRLDAASTSACLDDGRLDAAFVWEANAGPHLSSEHIRRELLVLATGQRHPLASRSHIALGDLGDTVLALPSADASPGLHAAVRGLLAQAGVSFRPGDAPADDDPWGLGAFVRGEAAAILPASQAESLRRLGAGICQIGPVQPEVDLFIVWNPEREQPTSRLWLAICRRLADARGWR